MPPGDSLRLVELVGGLEERISAELRGPKLKDLSTERLAVLLLKRHEIMAGLVAPVRFKAKYSYTISDIIGDKQTATAEWEG
jgi:hypothetical protein